MPRGRVHKGGNAKRLNKVRAEAKKQGPQYAPSKRIVTQAPSLTAGQQLLAACCIIMLTAEVATATLAAVDAHGTTARDKQTKGDDPNTTHDSKPPTQSHASKAPNQVQNQTHIILSNLAARDSQTQVSPEQACPSVPAQFRARPAQTPAKRVLPKMSGTSTAAKPRKIANKIDLLTQLFFKPAKVPDDVAMISPEGILHDPKGLVDKNHMDYALGWDNPSALLSKLDKTNPYFAHLRAELHCRIAKRYVTQLTAELLRVIDPQTEAIPQANIAHARMLNNLALQHFDAVGEEGVAVDQSNLAVYDRALTVKVKLDPVNEESLLQMIAITRYGLLNNRIGTGLINNRIGTGLIETYDNLIEDLHHLRLLGVVGTKAYYNSLTAAIAPQTLYQRLIEEIDRDVDKGVNRHRTHKLLSIITFEMKHLDLKLSSAQLSHLYRQRARYLIQEGDYSNALAHALKAKLSINDPIFSQLIAYYRSHPAPENLHLHVTYLFEESNETSVQTWKPWYLRAVKKLRMLLDHPELQADVVEAEFLKDIKTHSVAAIEPYFQMQLIGPGPLKVNHEDTPYLATPLELVLSHRIKGGVAMLARNGYPLNQLHSNPSYGNSTVLGDLCMRYIDGRLENNSLFEQIEELLLNGAQLRETFLNALSAIVRQVVPYDDKLTQLFRTNKVLFDYISFCMAQSTLPPLALGGRELLAHVKDYIAAEEDISHRQTLETIFTGVRQLRDYINVSSELGEPLLTHAMSSDYLVEMLRAGANPNFAIATDDGMITPLYYALLRDRVTIFFNLLAHPAVLVGTTHETHGSILHIIALKDQMDAPTIVQVVTIMRQKMGSLALSQLLLQHFPRWEGGEPSRLLDHPKFKDPLIYAEFKEILAQSLPSDEIDSIFRNKKSRLRAFASHVKNPVILFPLTGAFGYALGKTTASYVHNQQRKHVIASLTKLANTLFKEGCIKHSNLAQGYIELNKVDGQLFHVNDWRYYADFYSLQQFFFENGVASTSSGSLTLSLDNIQKTLKLSRPIRGLDAVIERFLQEYALFLAYAKPIKAYLEELFSRTAFFNFDELEFGRDTIVLMASQISQPILVREQKYYFSTALDLFVILQEFLQEIGVASDITYDQDGAEQLEIRVKDLYERVSHVGDQQSLSASLDNYIIASPKSLNAQTSILKDEISGQIFAVENKIKRYQEYRNQHLEQYASDIRSLRETWGRLNERGSATGLTLHDQKRLKNKLNAAHKLLTRAEYIVKALLDGARFTEELDAIKANYNREIEVTDQPRLINYFKGIKEDLDILLRSYENEYKHLMQMEEALSPKAIQASINLVDEKWLAPRNQAAAAAAIADPLPPVEAPAAVPPPPPPAPPEEDPEIRRMAEQQALEREQRDAVKARVKERGEMKFELVAYGALREDEPTAKPSATKPLLANPIQTLDLAEFNEIVARTMGAMRHNPTDPMPGYALNYLLTHIYRICTLLIEPNKHTGGHYRGICSRLIRHAHATLLVSDITTLESIANYFMQAKGSHLDSASMRTVFDATATLFKKNPIENPDERFSTCHPARDEDQQLHRELYETFSQLKNIFRPNERDPIVIAAINYLIIRTADLYKMAIDAVIKYPVQDVPKSGEAKFTFAEPQAAGKSRLARHNQGPIHTAKDQLQDDYFWSNGTKNITHFLDDLGKVADHLVHPALKNSDDFLRLPLHVRGVDLTALLRKIESEDLQGTLTLRPVGMVAAP